MSVKKMGSKLAQGVRQIKAQQDKASPAMAPVSAPVVAVAKAMPARAAARPVPAQVGESSTLHPTRVWPD
ncbi:hypothetical protein [Sulfuriferula sp.]|uniref:hypothetical protein n=1 Tax=Sulfuriferula sp. TaxID=2025307 RepID=UPI00272FA00A|nr:hypothetical protein [Sulfuriferula sp.]MDP2027164.1 hypothetical protein [Sulfuriferula sp.]